MEQHKLRKPEGAFLLLAILVALFAGWAVRNGALDGTQFQLLLVFAFPVTVPALLAILVTAGFAINRTFRARMMDPVFVAWSAFTVVFLVILLGGTSGFTAVSIAFLYAALTALNVVLSYFAANRMIRITLLAMSLAAASIGLFLWDEQQQRFRFPLQPSAKSEALLLAAYEGEAAEVERLLDEGADINAIDDAGWDALFNAVWRGHVDTARVLLERGANPDTRENKSGSFCYDLNCTEKINLSGSPAIVAAVNRGRDDLVQLLLDYGAIAHTTNNHCESPINIAARWGDAAMVQLLLNAGIDPNHKVKSCSQLPMVVAARRGHIDVIRILLEAGASVNLQNSAGRTALMFAAEKDDTESIELLLNAGANIALRDITGKTARDWALAEGHNEAAALLDGLIPNSGNRVPKKAAGLRNDKGGRPH